MELTEEESRRLAQELEVPLFLVDNDRQLYLLVDKLVERLGRKLLFEVKFTFLGEWFCEVATAAWCKGREVGPNRNIVICKAIADALRQEDKKNEEMQGYCPVVIIVNPKDD